MRFTEQTIIIIRHDWEYRCEITAYTPAGKVDATSYDAEAEFKVVSICPEKIEHSAAVKEADIDDIIDSDELNQLIIGALVAMGVTE